MAPSLLPSCRRNLQLTNSFADFVVVFYVRRTDAASHTHKKRCVAETFRMERKKNLPV